MAKTSTSSIYLLPETHSIHIPTRILFFWVIGNGIMAIKNRRRTSASYFILLGVQSLNLTMCGIHSGIKLMLRWVQMNSMANLLPMETGMSERMKMPDGKRVPSRSQFPFIAEAAAQKTQDQRITLSAIYTTAHLSPSSAKKYPTHRITRSFTMNHLSYSGSGITTITPYEFIASYIHHPHI